RRFLRRSVPLIGTSEADRLAYDAYIVGADTVWTPLRIHDVEAEMFYLDFARDVNVLKMSWSASIGAEDPAVLDEISPILARRLKNFDFISVRERETAAFVQGLTDKEVVHTMDPVLMLEMEDYLDILPGVVLPEKNTSSPSSSMIFPVRWRRSTNYPGEPGFPWPPMSSRHPW
ncbi:MAG: polysaccharide pyruvyl transferase family protein, partial [Clostridia bacterium]|nr:polysaccharide pyruvyl transferase family protein [Clostridia bacterium]